MNMTVTPRAFVLKLSNGRALHRVAVLNSVRTRCHQQWRFLGEGIRGRWVNIRSAATTIPQYVNSTAQAADQPATHAGAPRDLSRDLEKIPTLIAGTRVH
jgi:hypothetical protein